MDLSNRTVLVTGGTGGIGFGIAKAFKEAGSAVIVCGRNREKLAKARQALPGILAIPCDVGDAGQRKSLAAEVLRRFPALDVLVNNAGIQRYIDLKKGLAELNSGEDEIATNLVGTIEMTALFIEHLMKKPAAAIINVGSALGLMPMPNMPVYCATKAAIHTYSLVLRQQLKGTPVNVVEIVPPMVDTDLNRAGRDRIHLKHRGISVAEYMPSVAAGLAKGDETIFHGDGAAMMSEPRGKSETRLLNPSW
ncbi:MAG TPA: SDR family NAD(P)-dependent oxidoreductase [Chitinivibrionales bacterium]|nr:SDR family NAD(P)-dependent oxidoreductase [Chitinivibrionales bacterium]